MQINDVYYHVEARGAGDPLVLLHGFSGSGANWASDTSKRSRRIIASSRSICSVTGRPIARRPRSLPHRGTPPPT
ncbi:MAG: hypothetical protein U0521_02580 [Anaerolineae bacterium]